MADLACGLPDVVADEEGDAEEDEEEDEGEEGTVTRERVSY
jgi:hypothetical protein